MTSGRSKSAAQRRLEPAPGFALAFEEALPNLAGSQVPAIARLRAQSFNRFVAAGFPTTRVEAWKYTNLASLAQQAMAPAPAANLKLDEIIPHCLGGPRARRLIFVNGHLQTQWSHAHGLPDGVSVMSLQRAIETKPNEVAARLEALNDMRALTHLNTAFAGAGAWIEVGPGITIEPPLQLLFLTVGQTEPVMANPRCVIALCEGSSMGMIESHVGLGAGANLTNIVLQLSMAPGARLRHDRLQLLGDGMSSMSKLDARLDAGAQYAQTVATLGGAVVRNETELQLVGVGAEALLNGLTMPRASEHADNMIRIHHQVHGCHSDQFFKNIVDDHGHAVFAGKVIVHQDAQKTNAYQKNDSLILSDHAQVDSKPELEIYADDVKCSHGATCGDLDAQALFYLRSRGMPAAQARAVLTYAFVAEIVDKLHDPTASTAIKHAILARQPGGSTLEVLE